MSGCGNPNCKCKDKCTCTNGCSCASRSMAVPSSGGLRNYNREPDCKCGPACVDCQCDCHK